MACPWTTYNKGTYFFDSTSFCLEIKVALQTSKFTVFLVYFFKQDREKASLSKSMSHR